MGLRAPYVRSPTAKKTANLPDRGGQRRTILECPSARSNRREPLWTLADGSPAIFKTVCGALLRRPGWVRFPSIPATFRSCDSQVDRQRHKRFFRTSLNPGGKGVVLPLQDLQTRLMSQSLRALALWRRDLVGSGLDPGGPLHEPRPRHTGVEPMLISNWQEILFKNVQLST